MFFLLNLLTAKPVAIGFLGLLIYGACSFQVWKSKIKKAGYNECIEDTEKSARKDLKRRKKKYQKDLKRDGKKIKKIENDCEGKSCKEKLKNLL